MFSRIPSFDLSKACFFACILAIFSCFSILNASEISPTDVAQVFTDFGDAPDYPYNPLNFQTVLASDGARHNFTIPPTCFMGLYIDGEPNGQSTYMANGDDFNYYYPQPFPDDEDGVIIPKLGPSHIGPLFSGNSVPTFIYVDGGPTGGILQVWIDLNFNGTFDHPTEQVIPNTSIPPGALGGNPIKAIPIQIPSLPYTCQTYARFRLSPNGNLSPFGPCEGGEVEDYLVDLLWDQSLPVELRDLKAEFLRNSVIISWKTESESENRGFEIYRSNSENGDYQLISSYVTSIDLKGLGNSTLGKEYTYIDELVIPKGKVFYKIADISSSNEKEFHGPVVINFKDYSQEITPDKIGLLPNYPNPFNPSTTIKYQISEIGFVDLAIYDIKGNLVKTLVSRKMVSGTYTQKWDATNMNGIQLPSGIYIVRLISNNVSITQRILLMR